MKCGKCNKLAVAMYKVQHPSDQAQMIDAPCCTVHALLDFNEIVFKKESIGNRRPKLDKRKKPPK